MDRYGKRQGATKVAEQLAPTRPSGAETEMTMSRPENLTLAEFCAEHEITRSTFYFWCAPRKAPQCIRLPNGELRIKRSGVDRWLTALERASA